MASEELQSAIDQSGKEYKKLQNIIKKHDELLIELIHANGFELCEVPADGDCFFTATVNQMDGITVEILRQKCCDYMIENIDELFEFIPGKNKTEFRAQVESLRKPGTWSTDVCDILPLCVANIFSRPVTIFSSRADHEILDIVAAKNDTATPLIYAYNAAPGHEHYSFCKVVTKDDRIFNYKSNETDEDSDDNIPLSCFRQNISSDEDIPLANIKQGTKRIARLKAEKQLIDLDDGVQYDTSDDEYKPGITKWNKLTFIQRRRARKMEKWLSPQKSLPDDAHFDHNKAKEQKTALETRNNDSAKSTNDAETNYPQETNRGRKRTRDPNKWTKAIRKRCRNSGEEYISTTGKRVPKREPQPSNCKCHLKCKEKFSEDERQYLCTKYWELADHDRQRDYIKHQTVMTNKSRKTTSYDTQRRYTIFYYLKSKENQIQVCREFFTKTLDIGQGVVTWTLKHKTSSTDFRGKHTPPNKTHDKDVEFVKTHIKSFPAMPSHYCRSKTNRTYLESDLSITSMYNMYALKCKELQKIPVSITVYRRIFLTEFNLGFHRPKKDQCAFCTRYRHLSSNEKLAFAQEYEAHLRRKDMSRVLKNDAKCKAQSSNVTAITFDLQKVLNTPKGQASEFFYSRKLSVYNLTVYDMNSHQAKCYMWDETTASRGSIEIASCIYTFLKTVGEKREIYMFSDSCTGQQRNINFSAMCLYAVNNLPIDNINHTYFERGHSEMEGDSVHARIESHSKHVPIYSPGEWHTAVKMAKKNPPLYEVCVMKQSDFLDFKLLAKDTIVPKLMTKSGPLQWMKVHCFKYNKTENHMGIKYDLSDELQMVELQRPRRSSNSGSSIKNYTLKPAYTSPLPISKQKYDDLNHLCATNLIPQQFHSFYHNLPTSDVITDTLSQPDEDDSSDDEC